MCTPHTILCTSYAREFFNDIYEGKFAHARVCVCVCMIRIDYRRNINDDWRCTEGLSKRETEYVCIYVCVCVCKDEVYMLIIQKTDFASPQISKASFFLFFFVRIYGKYFFTSIHFNQNAYILYWSDNPPKSPDVNGFETRSLSLFFLFFFFSEKT